MSRKDFEGFKNLFHRFLQVKGPSVEWIKIQRPPDDSVRLLCGGCAVHLCAYMYMFLKYQFLNITVCVCVYKRIKTSIHSLLCCLVRRTLIPKEIISPEIAQITAVKTLLNVFEVFDSQYKTGINPD